MTSSKNSDKPDLVARVLGGRSKPPNTRLTAAAKAQYAQEVASSAANQRSSAGSSDDTPGYKKGGMVKKPRRK